MHSSIHQSGFNMSYHLPWSDNIIRLTAVLKSAIGCAVSERAGWTPTVLHFGAILAKSSIRNFDTNTQEQTRRCRRTLSLSPMQGRVRHYSDPPLIFIDRQKQHLNELYLVPRRATDATVGIPGGDRWRGIPDFLHETLFTHWAFLTRLLLTRVA